MVIELSRHTNFYPPSAVDIIYLVPIGMSGWMDRWMDGRKDG